MKALIASLTALGLIATTPTLAQTTNNTMSNKATTKAAPAKKHMAKKTTKTTSTTSTPKTPG